MTTTTGHALLTFAVSYSAGRPIRPDQHTTHVTLLAVDSSAGYWDAWRTAVAMVYGAHPCAMVTRTELLAAEL